MTQSLFTSVLPIRDGQQIAVRKILEGLGYQGPRPGTDPLCFSSLPMLHYACMAMYDDPQDGWALVFEVNTDGDITPFFNAFVAANIDQDDGQLLLEVLSHCDGFGHGEVSEIVSYLSSYIHMPAAGYSGCVGRSCKQILFEAEIYRKADAVLDGLDRSLSEAEVARAVHEAFADDPEFETLAEIPEQTPPADKLLKNQSLALLPQKSGVSVKRILKLVLMLFVALFKALFKLRILDVLKTLAALVVFLVMGLWNVVRKEAAAPVDAWRPDPGMVRAQRETEDYIPVNHMMSVVHLHTDLSRRLAKWSAFVLLQMLAEYAFVYGKLGAIPTIHFAHWAVLNKGRRLLFVSNFDGSWDSYLDDFTLKAASGLTLAWAHGKGLPRSRFMLKGGAAEGPAFIDWARRSMVPTLVWYSAYPELSIRQVNRNSALRQAIAEDKNRDNAGNWLELLS